jgi:hypothetical protein
MIGLGTGCRTPEEGLNWRVQRREGTAAEREADTTFGKCFRGKDWRSREGGSAALIGLAVAAGGEDDTQGKAMNTTGNN